MSGAESIYQSAPQGPTLVGSGAGAGAGVGVTCSGKSTSSVVPPRTSSYHSVPAMITPNSPPAAAAAPAIKIGAGIATARATGGNSANEFATRVDLAGRKGGGGAAREADSEEERGKEEQQQTQRGYEGLGHNDARVAAAQRGSSARVGGGRGGALKTSDLMREPSDGLIGTKGNSTIVSAAEGGGADAKDPRRARGLRRASASSSSSTEKGQEDSSSHLTTSATASITQYVKKHKIHLLLDGLVKDLLSEKPEDANRWMLRWFLEKHRSACEERHIRNSPQSLQKTNGSRKNVINADNGDDAADENRSGSSSGRSNCNRKLTSFSSSSSEPENRFSDTYERENVSTPRPKEKGGGGRVISASTSSPTRTMGGDKASGQTTNRILNDDDDDDNNEYNVEVHSNFVATQSLQRSARPPPPPPPPRLPIGIFVQSESKGGNGSHHHGGEQQFLSVSAQSKASPNVVVGAVGATGNPFSSSSSPVREEQDNGLTMRYTASSSRSTHQQEEQPSGTGSRTATTTCTTTSSTSALRHGGVRLRDDTDGSQQGRESSLSSAHNKISSSLPPSEERDESGRHLFGTARVGTTCPSTGVSSSSQNGRQHSSDRASKNGNTSVPITITSTMRRESRSTDQQDGKEQSTRRVPEGNLHPQLHSPTTSSSCGEEESAASSSFSPSASVAAVAEAVVALTVEEAVSGSNSGSVATTPAITPSSTRSPPEMKANSGCLSPAIMEKSSPLKTINNNRQQNTTRDSSLPGSRSRENGVGINNGNISEDKNNVDKEIDEGGAEPLSDPLFVSSPELTTEANEVDQQLMSAVLIHKAAQLKESTSPQEEQRRMEDLQNKLRGGGGGGTGGGVSLLASLSPSSVLREAQDRVATDKTNRRLDMAHTDL